VPTSGWGWGVLTGVTSVEAGIEAEIEGCIRGEYARLVGAVSMVIGSVALAEEAVQEAFARAWERARRGRTFDHLAGWVATVALNNARSGRRRGASERRAIERVASR
jgi:RNA polymerase sigma-70 factor, ECF subfamily